MKKKIKIALLAMLLCVGLVFTGCGGQLDTDVNVNIGNEADYVACTESNAIMTAVAQEPDSPEATPTTQAIKFTLKVKMTMPTGIDDETTTVDVKANVVLEVTEVEGDSKMGLACKLEATTPEDGTQVYEIYIKDGYLYANDGTEKMKMSLSDIPTDDSSTSTLIDAIIDVVGDITESINDYTKQKVTADGSKYMVDVNGTNIYFIIKDQQVAQVYVKVTDISLADIMAVINPEIADSVPEIMIEYSIGLEVVSNKIDYPSFDDYEEMPML